MADRYWVGGSGNWSDNTNHWATTSGGAPGASKPASGDTVYIDDNSPNGSDFTITVDEITAALAYFTENCNAYNCTIAVGDNTLDVSTYPGTFTMFYGNLTVNVGTISIRGTIVINAGASFGSNTAYTLQIGQDASNVGNMNCAYAGSFDAPNASGTFNAYVANFQNNANFPIDFRAFLC